MECWHNHLPVPYWICPLSGLSPSLFFSSFSPLTPFSSPPPPTFYLPLPPPSPLYLLSLPHPSCFPYPCLLFLAPSLFVCLSVGNKSPQIRQTAVVPLSLSPITANNTRLVYSSSPQANNPHALRRRYEREKLVAKIPEGTSRHLASLLAKLLRKNPRDRLAHGEWVSWHQTRVTSYTEGGHRKCPIVYTSSEYCEPDSELSSSFFYSSLLSSLSNLLSFSLSFAEDLSVHPFLANPSIQASGTYVLEWGFSFSKVRGEPSYLNVLPPTVVGYLMMAPSPPRAKSSPVPIRRHTPSPSRTPYSSRHSHSPVSSCILYRCVSRV